MLRYTELVREAANQRLADQLAGTSPGVRKRLAAVLYALATRLDASLTASRERQASATFGAAAARGGRCDVAPGLF
jgi:hypothetical protein